MWLIKDIKFHVSKGAQAIGTISLTQCWKITIKTYKHSWNQFTFLDTILTTKTIFDYLIYPVQLNKVMHFDEGLQVVCVHGPVARLMYIYFLSNSIVRLDSGTHWLVLKKHLQICFHDS